MLMGLIFIGAVLSFIFVLKVLQVMTRDEEADAIDWAIIVMCITAILVWLCVIPWSGD
jgi:hypothetical protein